MSRIRKINMTGVDTFTRCEEGIHTAKIVEIQEGTTQAGDDMLTGVFEVINGTSKGCKVYDNFVLTDKALWKLKQLLQSVHVKCDGKIALDLDKLIGKVCDIAVYHDEYNGKIKARIDEYTPTASDSSDDEDEDDDEEEEEEIKKTTKKSKSPKSEKSTKPTKKNPEPVEDDEDEDDDEDWDDEDEIEEEEEKPKKSTKSTTKKSAAKSSKSKKKSEPEPVEDDDEDWDDDDDEDWEEE